MPLIRIDLPAGKSDIDKQAVGDALQQALHDALGVPMAERFQVFTEHGPGCLVMDPGYGGVSRSADAMVVQVTLNRGRDAAKKQAFFKAAVEELRQKAGIRPADVVISLVEVRREDWSFGLGEAQSP